MAWDRIKCAYLLCNAEKEPERYKRLIPHVLMHGIPKDKLKLASPTWYDTLSTESIFNVYNPYLNRGNIPKFKSGPLTKKEISLNINFYNIVLNSLNDISGNGCVLVLESDVILRRDFNDRLTSVISDLSGVEWDYVSLSSSDCDVSYNGPTKLYSPPNNWTLRGTNSMLLNMRFIENLQKTFLPFKEPLEWELNFQMLLHKGVALWCNPPLVSS